MSQAEALPVDGTPRGRGLPRLTTVLVGAASAVVVLGGLHAASQVVGPIFFALVLTVTVHPLKGMLTRRGLPGWVATLGGILAVFTILIGLTVATVLATAQFATMLPEYQSQFTAMLDDVEKALHKLGVGEKPAGALMDALSPSELISSVIALLGNLLGVVTNLFFVLTMLFFLALDATTFPRNLREGNRAHPAFGTAMTQFATGTRTYFWVATLFGLLIAVLNTLVLYVLDVPSPLLWGLLSFITGYIPNVGFLIGLVPPAVLALLDSGPALAIGVIVAYTVINTGIQTILQPRIVGEAVGLSTSLSFISLIFWAYVLGIYGALMAVPLTLLVKALLVDVDPASRWVSPMISGAVAPRDAPEPQADPT